MRGFLPPARIYKGKSMPIKGMKPKKIMKKIMEEYKSGELNIGKSKKKVKKRSQAIAVSLSMAGLSNKSKKGKKSKPKRK